MSEKLPLVSCLMVTRGTNTNLIENSLYSYSIQTYKNRELIIVTDCNTEDLIKLQILLNKYDDGSFKLVVTDGGIIIGTLRNISIESSSGEYCIQWDDDDFYHQDRIMTQYLRISSSDYDYCMLKDFMMYFYNTHILSKHTWFDDEIHGMPPSIMFKRNIEYRYPPTSHGEDIVITQPQYDFLKKCYVVNQPHLYVYVYHGNNSYRYDHYCSLSNGTRGTLERQTVQKVTQFFGKFGLDYRI